MEVGELKQREAPALRRLLTFLLATTHLLQVSLVLLVQFTRTVTENGEVDLIEFPIRTPSQKISSGESHHDLLDEAFALFDERIDDMCQRGSNWIVTAFLSLSVEVGRCANIFGSSSKFKVSTINNRMDLETKTKRVNVGENDDGECFFRCIALFFLGKKFNEKTYQEFKKDHLNITIPCPVEIKKIKKFERDNQHLNAQINVFCQDTGDQDLFPIYLSPYGGKNQINLLLLFAKKSETEFPPHFMLITDLNKLIRKKYSGQKQHGFSYDTTHLCLNCMTKFSNRNVYENHQEYCKKHTPHILYPPNHTHLEFKRWRNKFERPIVCFYDFECGNQYDEKTKKILQKAISFCIICVSKAGELICERTYAGNDAEEKFIEKLLECEEKIIEYIEKTYIPLDWEAVSKEEKDFFYSENVKCHICEKIIFKDEIKHKDHCHFTGKFFGPSHVQCNINRVEDMRTPCFAHNSSSYDFKVLMLALSHSNPKCWRVEVLPKNGEKMTAIFINNFTFIDSLSFLPSSLENVVETLMHSKKELLILKQSQMYNNEKERDLLLKKGLYPYDFVKDYDQIKNCQLPSYEEFYSLLRKSDISKSDYLHAKSVYRTFSCRNLLDYTILYNRLDVYLLAECFWNFRQIAYREFKLDPANYISLPAFSMDAMLYMTKAKIELLQDLDMYLLIESHIRGGLSLISERYLKASPEMSEEKFNSLTAEEKKRVYRILYLDQNNLYGGQLRKNLPISNFEWMTEADFKKINWLNTNSNSSKGYILEIDISYPKKLHKEHESIPLCPHHKNITYKDLTEYSKMAYSKSRNEKTYKSKKLTASFEKKIKYVIHYDTLREYLKLGMKLDKVHRVISFNQEPFMQKYIDHCTHMGKISKTPAEKSLFKLATNAIYGKSLESRRNRLTCHIFRNETELQQKMASKMFHNFKIINENLVLAFQKQRDIYMENPIFIGFSVLDFAKESMYSAFYRDIRPLLGLSTRCLATDTDSFLLAVNAASHESCMKKLQPIMDFSNYPPSHSLYDPSRRNALGYFKDETSGIPIDEYVGIRAKVYSYRLGKSVKRVCKGVQKITKNQIPFKTFKNCLKNDSLVMVKQHTIGSKSQQLFVHTQRRMAFSSSDDKMMIKRCKIHTTPYNSVHFEEENKNCTLCKYMNEKLYYGVLLCSYFFMYFLYH